MSAWALQPSFFDEHDLAELTARSVPTERLSAPAAVEACKNLDFVERAFCSIKGLDLQVRPIYHHLHSFRTLLTDLATLTKNLVRFGGARFERLTTPTPVQQRAFDLLGVPVRP